MKRVLLSIVLALSLLSLSFNPQDNMAYKTRDLAQFYVVGISVRTTNQYGQSQQDIGALWVRFMKENIGSQIHNKVSEDTYCVYTDYESDANGKYTTVLGYKVNSLDSIPKGMTGITIPACHYHVHTSTGKLPDCVVTTWMNIWKADIKRKYAADFDIYGAKAADQNHAEVETYLSVK